MPSRSTSASPSGTTWPEPHRPTGTGSWRPTCGRHSCAANTRFRCCRLAPQSSSRLLLPPASSAPRRFPDTASKAGLSGLCAYVAKEAAPRRVRVNVVMPGLIDTSLGRLASLVKPDRDSTPIPLGRQGTGWDVAAAAAFLLSDAADYITGQTLAVDGGLSEVR